MSSTRGRLMTSSMFLGALAFSAPVAAGLALMAAPGVSAAQDYTTGTLNGRVINDAGQPIAGASVAIRSGQGQTRTVTTNARGEYQAPALAFGTYTAAVSAQGFNPTTNQVIVAQGGSAYDFTLSAAGTASGPRVGEVVVTASRARRTQDFNRTETGLTVDVQELTSRVPVGRGIGSVVQLAPSTSIVDPTLSASNRRGGQTITNVAGASAAESVYYINGLNVTDQRLFLGFADLPFDAIQSVDVKTGGYSAEFGRATGGVVNIVTRSGSNEFHGGGSFFYTPHSLREKSPTAYGPGASNVAGQIFYNSTYERELLEGDLWISGPIVKDRLFFFGMVNPRQDDVRGAIVSNGPTGLNATNGTQTYSTTNDPRWLMKFDLNITPKQRVEATVFSDASDTRYQTYTTSTLTGVSAVAPYYVSSAGGVNEIIRYTGVWTDWFTLSALFGQVRNSYTDFGPLATIPRVRDLTGVPSPRNPTGGTQFLTSSNTAGLFNLADEDSRDTYRVDADFYFNALGSHHVRVGYDLEQLTSTDQGSYNGGYIMDVRQSATLGLYALQTVYLTGGNFTAEQSAYYLQDSWKILPNLTLELGVRNDLYDYKNSSGVSFIKLEEQFAPRIGFAWDPFRKGNDKVFGSYGHYYLPVAENLAIRGSGPNPYYQAYYRVTRDASGNIVTNANGVPVLGAEVRARNILQNADVPDPRAVVASNLSPMYAEEFVIGWDHTFRETGMLGGFFDNWRAGIRYIDRQLAETIEDTNVQTYYDGTSFGDGAVGRYCQRNKISLANCAGALEANYGHFTSINPGKDARVFLQGFGPNGAGQYVTLTKEDLLLPEVENHYQAMELTFERPFDGKWGLQGSYTLAFARGNYTGAVSSDTGQTDVSALQDFDQYYNEIGATGDLPTAPRHTVKLFGTYQPFKNFTIGANYIGQSGRPYSCFGYAPQDQDPGGTPSTFYCPQPNGVTHLVPRGTAGTTPWVNQVDLTLAYRFQLSPTAGAIQARVDVFNVFNDQEVTRVSERGEVTNLPGTLTAFYGRPRNYQAPRSIRFGLSYAF